MSGTRRFVRRTQRLRSLRGFVLEPALESANVVDRSEIDRLVRRRAPRRSAGANATQRERTVQPRLFCRVYRHRMLVILLTHVVIDCTVLASARKCARCII